MDFSELIKQLETVEGVAKAEVTVKAFPAGDLLTVTIKPDMEREKITAMQLQVAITVSVSKMPVAFIEYKTVEA